MKKKAEGRAGGKVDENENVEVISENKWWQWRDQV